MFIVKNTDKTMNIMPPVFSIVPCEDGPETPICRFSDNFIFCLVLNISNQIYLFK